ncbi:MAG TPA: hypothetical protein VKR58_08430, partial [Aquella sp.]|nr:hypothetical protein [Aquella sp.]
MDFQYQYIPILKDTYSSQELNGIIKPYLDLSVNGVFSVLTSLESLIIRLDSESALRFTVKLFGNPAAVLEMRDPTKNLSKLEQFAMYHNLHMGLFKRWYQGIDRR